MQKYSVAPHENKRGHLGQIVPRGSARRCVQMALPTEAREVSEFNGLEKGLGQQTPIELQCVSGTAPKPLMAFETGTQDITEITDTDPRALGSVRGRGLTNCHTNTIDYLESPPQTPFLDFSHRVPAIIQCGAKR